MKKVLRCVLVILLLTPLSVNAVNNFTLWVGESMPLEFEPMGSWYNVKWSSDVPYVEINGGSNFTREAKVARYFKGTAIVSVSWDEQLYFNGPFTHKRKEWYIKCQDNPISLYQGTKLSLSIGETAQLNYKLKYDNQYSSNAKPYFYSSNADIVSCTEQGYITALKEGSTYVYVSSNISAEPAFCVVTVTSIKPTKISIPETLTLKVGEEKQLIPTITPSNATTKLTWHSNVEPIVTVSDTGVVKGIMAGEADIRVVTDNDIKAECKVKVIVEPESIKIKGYTNAEAKQFELFVKDSIDATVYLYPSAAMQSATIIVTSKDNSIATAKPFLGLRSMFFIYGHKVGETSIEFKTENGLTALTKVVVKGFTTSVEDGVKIRKFHEDISKKNKIIDQYLK